MIYFNWSNFPLRIQTEVLKTQEGLTGPLRPQNFCPTLQLHYTVGFSLIDVK